MSSERPHPPALATWLLLHLCPKRNREALTGDLFERFGEGRSDSWFWLQVLTAIAVGGSRELSAHWSYIGFAVIGTALLRWSSWAQLNRSPAVERVFVWGVRLQWPLSMLFNVGLLEAMRALIVLPIVALLLLLNATFRWAILVRTFLLSLALLTVGDFVSGWLVGQMNITHDSPTWMVIPLLAIKTARPFFPLLIAAWVSCPLPSRSRRAALG